MNKLFFKLGLGSTKGKIAIAILVLPALVFAQTPGSGTGTSGAGEPPPLPSSPTTGFCDVIRILSLAARWMFWILMLLSVVFVLIAAFKYLTSAGDPGKVGEASKTIIYAAVAIAVAMIARGVPAIVLNLLRTDNVITPGNCVGSFFVTR